MKELRVNTGNEGGSVFQVNEGYNLFNQLAVKIDMNDTTDEDYFSWLDKVIQNTHQYMPDVVYLEKDGARYSPPLNTAVYYDTEDYKLLPTGALLRTSCNTITHAFCAFKMPEDEHGNRLDRRHVFEGAQKKIIQQKPYSEEAIKIVKSLLMRDDIEHPGTYLKKHYDISVENLSPAMVLFGNRSTFYVRLNGYDILRCSLDRSKVFDFRKDPEGKTQKIFREVELSIYPRVSEKIVGDKRIIKLLEYLTNSLCQEFKKEVIYEIKYQRGAKLLGLH